MEHLKDDLFVWWEMKKDFNLPLSIFGAIIMSTMTLIAYSVSAVITAGSNLKTFIWSKS